MKMPDSNSVPIHEQPQYYPGGCSSTRCTHCNEWLGIDELDNMQMDADGNEHYYCSDCWSYHMLGSCDWCERICDPDYAIEVKIEGGSHPNYEEAAKVYIHANCLTEWLKNFEDARWWLKNLEGTR